MCNIGVKVPGVNILTIMESLYIWGLTRFLIHDLIKEEIIGKKLRNTVKSRVLAICEF